MINLDKTHSEVVSVLTQAGINKKNFSENFLLCKVLLCDDYTLLTYFEKNNVAVFNALK